MQEDGGDEGVAASNISFIYDEPAEEDRFKTHSRLAAAIASAITSSPRLRVIGLLGRWGSGKSTVIRHLGKMLSVPQAGRIFFTYDAWLNQGSPIRRSFLEGLLEFLVVRNLPDAGPLQIELDQLTGKRVVEDKFTAPVLTKDAAFLFVSLLGWPIALSLLKLETLKDYFGNATSDGARVAFYVGILLLLLPLLLALIFWGIRHKRATPDQPAAGILPALLNKTIETKRETTLKLPDPTPTQFADLFRKIMKTATSTGTKYVLVIDNLDRLPETEAMQVWAAVRSFFVDTYDPAHSWQPVVIIPIDRVAIEEMFQLTHGDKGRSASELANSFISKSFDITFEVTEPVMSDWRDFLREKLTAVFGKLATEDTRYWIVNLFDARSDSGENRGRSRVG